MSLPKVEKVYCRLHRLATKSTQDCTRLGSSHLFSQGQSCVAPAVVKLGKTGAQFFCGKAELQVFDQLLNCNLLKLTLIIWKTCSTLLRLSQSNSSSLSLAADCSLRTELLAYQDLLLKFVAPNCRTASFHSFPIPFLTMFSSWSSFVLRNSGSASQHGSQSSTC